MGGCLITAKNQEKQHQRYLGFQRNERGAYLKAVERIKKLRALEQKLLSSMVTCPGAASYTRKLPSVDYSSLQGKVRDGFYDPQLTQKMLCLANSLYIDDKTLGLRFNERLRTNLALAPLGAGSYGVALRATLREAKDLFVIKAPISQEGVSDTNHEAVVGIFGTNKLRAYCPNFSLVYGFFRCSPPLTDKKGVTTWCSSTDKVSVGYVIYENIAPSQTLNRVIRSGASTKQIMELYLQVLFALKIGQKIGFTHYDLHVDNVVGREVAAGTIYIPYVEIKPPPPGSPPGTPGTTLYLRSTSGKVATIIDYGTSYFQDEKIGGGTLTGFGFNGSSAPMYEHSVFDDRSFPIHDAYKLFCSSLLMGSTANKAFYEEAKPLLRFWNLCDNLDDIISGQRKYYYAVPEIARGKLNLDDWIDRCIEWMDSKGYGGVVTDRPPAGARIVRCPAGGCPTINIFPSEATPRPRVLSEFADYASLFSEAERREYLPAYQGVLRDEIKGLPQEIKVPEDAWRPPVRLYELFDSSSKYRELLEKTNNILKLLESVSTLATKARWIEQLKPIFPEANLTADEVLVSIYALIRPLSGYITQLRSDTKRILDFFGVNIALLKWKLSKEEWKAIEMEGLASKEINEGVRRRYLAIDSLLSTIPEFTVIIPPPPPPPGVNGFTDQKGKWVPRSPELMRISALPLEGERTISPALEIPLPMWDTLPERKMELPVSPVRQAAQTPLTAKLSTPMTFTPSPSPGAPPPLLRIPPVLPGAPPPTAMSISPPSPGAPPPFLRIPPVLPGAPPPTAMSISPPGGAASSPASISDLFRQMEISSQ